MTEVEGEHAEADRPTGSGQWRALSVVVLLAAGVLLVLTIGITRPTGPDGGFPVPRLRPEPDSAVPRAGVRAPVDRPNASDADALGAWARRVAEETDIPARVAQAYGRAEMWMRSERADCGLRWTLLAGIGRVESRHGAINGSRVSADGGTVPPITGPPLDGSAGFRAIPDTDGGDLDGDTTWDRAVGPMQFLPATWRQWRARASRDGALPDPHDIDDAALSAARYLCGRRDEVRTPAGWWRAVLRYNRSVDYAQDVFSGADAYAVASRALRSAASSAGASHGG